MAGDADAEAGLAERYKNGIAIIIGRIVQDDFVTEDLSQETLRIVIEKIRAGEVREPDRLSGFICGVARFVAIEYIRKQRRTTGQQEPETAEHIRDPQANQFDKLWHKERAEIMRELLNELKVERDREVLRRYYFAEEDKEQICANLGLSSKQFNSVIFRALKRYKELYTRRFGEN